MSIRRKQRSPEKVRRRFKFAVWLIAIMLIIAIIPIGKNNMRNEEEKERERTVEMMDSALDSLLRNDAGIPIKVVSTGDVENTTEPSKETAEKLKTINRLKGKEIAILSKNEPDTTKLFSLKQEIEELERDIQNGRNDDRKALVRRIEITVAGDTLTGYQKLIPETMESWLEELAKKQRIVDIRNLDINNIIFKK